MVFYKRLRFALFAFSGLIIGTPSYSQLPPIYIFGVGSGSGSWNSDPGGGISMGVGEPFPGYSALLAGATNPEASPSKSNISIISKPIEKSNTNSIPRAYESSRDWRVLFESLLQRGAEGGGLYATAILVRCSGMLEIAARFNQAAASQAQENARQLFIARCASFASDEGTLERAMTLTRDSRLKDDPYLALADASSTDTSIEARRSLVSRYFQTGDTLLLERLGVYLFYPAEGSDVTFDGMNYRQEHAKEIFQKTWLAAICEASDGACGTLGDPYVNEMCAVVNQCFENRKDLMVAWVRQDFGDEATKLFAQIYPRLVNVIRDKRSSAFF